MQPYCLQTHKQGVRIYGEILRVIVWPLVLSTILEQRLGFLKLAQESYPHKPQWTVVECITCLHLTQLTENSI